MTYTPSLARKRLERRRLKAGKLFGKGTTQAEAARLLRVTPAAVNQWRRVWQRHGMDGLKSKGRPGPVTALTPVKARRIKAALLKGPRAFGYSTDLWTLECIRTVVRRVTGLSFGLTWIWQIVTNLGFSCQRPQLRNKERDESAIVHWRSVTFPVLKKMG
jgi:transposase